MRWTDFAHLSVNHLATIGHPHRRTYGDHADTGIHRRPDNAVQGFLVQDTIHIRTHEIGIRHHIHTGVGGIGLRTAVNLVHHRQALEDRIVGAGFI